MLIMGSIVTLYYEKKQRRHRTEEQKEEELKNRRTLSRQTYLVGNNVKRNIGHKREGTTTGAGADSISIQYNQIISVLMFAYLLSKYNYSKIEY